MVKFKVKDKTLVIDASNWLTFPSIEDNASVMAIAIELLRRNKGIEKIVFSQEKQIEYDYFAVKMLNEIAELLDSIELHEKEMLKYSKLRKIIQTIKKDPLLAYFQLNVLLSKTKDAELFVLATKLKEMMESLTMLKIFQEYAKDYEPGLRKIYRKIFMPMIRPNFMTTSFYIFPPRNAVLIDSYKLRNGSKAEIYRIPGKVRHYYHLIAPEFLLGMEEQKIINLAKDRIAEATREIDYSNMERARETFKDIAKSTIRQVASEENIRLSKDKVEELAEILTRHTAGFGILEILISDDKLQDIYINSPIGFTPVFVFHSDFEECETNVFPSKEDAEVWATRFRLYSGRPLDEANPVLDTELFVPGGRARVAAITRTLSPEGLAFAIRRHRDKPWTFPLFIKVRYFNALYAGLMSFLADGGRAILIAGGRSSGKTSLLSSLILELMRKYRIIIQEDTRELPVEIYRKLGYNVENLKTRSVITQVETELPADEALRTALRLGDSVLIIGEIRSVEGKALFEAMRIGALANLVAGTIHGESAYGVYDRIVNDLGVPKTSFKAVDIVSISNMLKSPDGLHRFRRVVELTEIRKKWQEDPLQEGAFVNLMEYSAKQDELKPTDTLLNGESEVINAIAKRVREWRGNWEAVWSNIMLRARIKQTMVDYALKLKRPEILEAEYVVQANEYFHLISDEVKQEVGALDSELIYARWLSKFKQLIKHF